MKEKRNCLSCKYEPDWGKWTTGEYERCSGKCKNPVDLSKIPSCYIVKDQHVIRYRDNSGIETHCSAWESK